MKKASFILVISLLVLFYVPSLAEDSGYGHIVGDRKYFGRDYIVKNPRATLPPPSGIPLAKMDSTQECELWRQDTRIVRFNGPGFHPEIAAVGDTIHIVWQQDLYLKTYHDEVFYARSTDGGKTWSDSIPLSDVDDSISSFAQVAAYYNYVHVFWGNIGLGIDRIIYYRRSTDAGDSWLPKQVIKKSLLDSSGGGQRPTARDGILYLTYSWGD
ncbi:MAG: hypothetical protein ACE5K2_03485, partial [Candidatus Zixiibacteriota bacterium]